MFKIISKREHQWMKDQIDTLRGRVWDLTMERDSAHRDRENFRANGFVLEDNLAQVRAERDALATELAELKAKGTPRVRGAGGRWAKVETSQEQGDRVLAEDRAARGAL